LNNLGRCYDALGQYEKAIGYHEKSLALKAPIANPQDIASSLFNLAHCDLLISRPEESLAHLEACIAEIAQVGRATQSEKGRAAFLEEWAALPSLICAAVHTLAAAPDARALTRGFPLIESLRSRTMLEGLHERAEGLLSTMDPDLAKERETTLNRMVE